MSTCTDLQYFLDDFGDFEFDEEEYIRSCFGDLSDKQPEKVKQSKERKSDKVRKPNVYTKQTIPPEDIRRTYAKLFESAWNNYDKAQLHDVFHGFGTEDMLTIVVYPHGNPHGPAYREIHGPQATTEYFYAYLRSVPDSLFFIHETKFVIKQNGNISIVCKFTLTGSRLYLINNKNNSNGDTVVTAAPIDVEQQESFRMMSSYSEDSHDGIGNTGTGNAASEPALVGDKEEARDCPDLDEYLDAYNAFKQHIVFKDAYSVKNKHDKYRRLNHSTIGEYIDCSTLTADDNLEVDGKQYAAEMAENTRHNSKHSISSSSTPKANKKQRVCSSDTLSSSSLLTANNAPSSDTLKLLYSGRASASKGRDDATSSSSDIVVSDYNATFSLGAILPSAVRSNMCGILRFHVGADKKVYKLELMCAFKDDDNDSSNRRSSSSVL